MKKVLFTIMLDFVFDGKIGDISYTASAQVYVGENSSEKKYVVHDSMVVDTLEVIFNGKSYKESKEVRDVVKKLKELDVDVTEHSQEQLDILIPEECNIEELVLKTTGIKLPKIKQ
jgi:hypothetical protein